MFTLFSINALSAANAAAVEQLPVVIPVRSSKQSGRSFSILRRKPCLPYTVADDFGSLGLRIVNIGHPYSFAINNLSLNPPPSPLSFVTIADGLRFLICSRSDL